MQCLLLYSPGITSKVVDFVDAFACPNSVSTSLTDLVIDTKQSTFYPIYLQQRTSLLHSGKLSCKYQYTFASIRI